MGMAQIGLNPNARPGQALSETPNIALTTTTDLWYNTHSR